MWQSLFYLLGIEREEICETDTNKLQWKFAKKQLDVNAKLLEKLIEYEPQGPKPRPQAYYTTLNFIEKNIEHYYPEDIDAYSASILGRIFKWILNAVKLRRQDIVRRISLQRRAKDQREEAIQKEAKRQERMVSESQDAENKFNDDHRDEIEAALAYQQREKSGDDEGEENEPVPVMPVFNKQEFLNKWLAENPPIEIPQPVVDDEDNDWILSQSEVEYHINTYFGKD